MLNLRCTRREHGRTCCAGSQITRGLPTPWLSTRRVLETGGNYSDSSTAWIRSPRRIFGESQAGRLWSQTAPWEKSIPRRRVFPQGRSRTRGEKSEKQRSRFKVQRCVDLLLRPNRTGELFLAGIHACAAWAAEQTLGANPYSTAAPVQAAAAQAHRVEKRHCPISAGGSRTAVCLRVCADTGRIA